MVNLRNKAVNSTLVKPAIHTDEPMKIPLTIFDRIMLNLTVPVLMAFRAPTPSNQVILDALARLIVHYPHLSGKLINDSRSPYILVDRDAGVPVVEAEVDADLADYLPLEPSHDLDDLYPNPENQLDRTMSMKVSRFSCGGITVGLSSNHRVCDGQSMVQFQVNWGRLIRGLELEPLPVYNRSLIRPRDPPIVKFPHQEIEFEQPTVDESRIVPQELITNAVVHFSREFVAKLRERAGDSGSTKPFSRFQCMAAHIWRKVCEARGLEDNQQTMMVVTVNGRPKLNIPNNYFGNVVLCAFPSTTANELYQGGISHGAKVIYDAVNYNTSEDYFKSFVDFGALNEGQELVPSMYGHNSYGPDLEVDSWLGFELSSLDFGGGGLCAFIGHVEPIEGVVTLIPSTKGGVDVHASLLKHHVETFKMIAHNID